MNTYRVFSGEQVQVSKNRSYTLRFVEMPDGYGPEPLRKTICAAKCGQSFLRVLEDLQEGLCHICWKGEFEGEPEMLL